MAELDRFSFDGIGVAELDGGVFFDADRAVKAAREHFKVDYLFPWQRIVIANILDGQEALRQNPDFYDVRDDDSFYRGRQIVLLPTGAGKSMCFLVPALLLDGATLVIYPLLALMDDQIRRMRAAGINCVVFRGGQSREEREENFRNLRNTENPAKVIVANPEVLLDERLLEGLKTVNISHVAVDEAHCVYEWGDTFRPAYLELGKVIKELGAKLVTAFTATASPVVLDKIGGILFDGSYHLVRGESDRPNIHYEVRYACAKEKAALGLALEMKKPLIIFCGTRSRSEEMAYLCLSCFGPEKVRFYHAGLSKEEKNQVEKWFFSSKDGILTATCAYGMGVDKADIAGVIHLDVPLHLENYVQEAGRAGRNGEDVRAVLLWSHRDFISYRHAAPGSREKAVGEFAMGKSCRRQALLDYLGGEKALCSGCDICDAEKKGVKIRMSAEDGEIAFDFIKRNQGLYSKKEASRKISEKINSRYKKLFGRNLWEMKDSNEVLAQLLSERRVMLRGFFGERRVFLSRKSLLPIPRRYLRCLHFLRRKVLRVQVLARRLFS